MTSHASGARLESADGVRPRRVRSEPRASSTSRVSIERRTGRFAEAAQLRARMDMARELGDVTEERVVTRALAVRLAAQGSAIDEAIELASAALARAEDAELRGMLVGWLEGLGEPGLAASELRKSTSRETLGGSASRFVRIGILHARADDPLGARDAFLDAAGCDERDARPLELLGAYVASGRTTFASEVGIEAYVRAAERRSRAGDVVGELEDLQRAFELGPSNAIAAASLVAAYTARGNLQATDAVLRRHGSLLSDGSARTEGETASESEAPSVRGIHARRRARALERGDVARALAAAFDDKLDSEFDGVCATEFDALLARAGLFEMLAVRLSMRAGSEEPDHGIVARRWADLGRLFEGPLAMPERAIEAYAHSFAADATDVDVRQALLALSVTCDASSSVVEAFIRATMGADASGASPVAESRLAGARALADYSERAGDLALASWAYGMVGLLDPDDFDSALSRARLEESARCHSEAVERAECQLDGFDESDRAAGLERLAGLLRSDPARSQRLLTVLKELVSLRPFDDELRAYALRIAERHSDFDGMLALCETLPIVGRASSLVAFSLLSASSRSGGAAAAANAATRLFDPQSALGSAVAWGRAVVSRDVTMRGHALAAIAASCSTDVAGVLFTIASEQLAHVGEPAPARNAAERGSRANAEDARALRALADSASPTEDRVLIAALEREASVLGSLTPSACRRLAQAYERDGQSVAAVNWARRAVVFSPSNGEVIQWLIDLTVRVGDSAGLADALEWTLAQAVSARDTATSLAPALKALAARDLMRSVVIARLALDTLGPRDASLREAIEGVAKAAKDDRLSVRLIERWVAAGASLSDRASLLVALATLYAASGDVELELAAYARALRCGLEPGSLRARVDALGACDLSPDAELALASVRAALSVEHGSSADAVRDLRAWGAALWDMASDRPRALQAWLHAAELDTAGGYATLRHDLSTFADVGYAADCLAELVPREADSSRASSIATEAAYAAIQSGSFSRAFSLARLALGRLASHAEALAIAEVASDRLDLREEMAPLYERAARGALGRFGRRAVHRRAARFFELHLPRLALKHAAQAFIAVPSEGMALSLLERTAVGAGRRAVAVRTLEYVADFVRDREVRAEWLVRASRLTSRDVEGARQKVDLLLKAVVAMPASATLGMVSVATRELVSLAADDDEALAIRLERAHEALARVASGPDGARMAVTFATMALELFDDPAWAWRAIERALAADGDVDEYAQLLPFAIPLARAKGASESLARVDAACAGPFCNAGSPLFRLVGEVARLRGDDARRVRASVRAAEKEPDDDLAIVHADAAVAAYPEVEFAERLARVADGARRVVALRAVARKQSECSDFVAAVSSLERALSLASGDQKREVTGELADALESAGRVEEARLLEIAVPEREPKERAVLWSSLARIRQRRGDTVGGVEALLRAATDDPCAARWAAVEGAAHSAACHQIWIQALRNLTQLHGFDGRFDALKRLARAEGAHGSRVASESVWRDVLQASPGDVEADAALEALLVARHGYDDLAEHLARRLSALKASGVDHGALRALRLRRAAVLEQRLGRFLDAAAELRQVLVETPNHPSALRWLADLLERAKEPSLALDALEQIAATTTNPGEQVTVGLRRVRALLEIGEVVRASDVIAPFLGPEASAEVREVNVELARAVGEAGGLGSALEDLARVSKSDPRTRSEMLVEAAQAAARAGDAAASLSRAKNAASLAPDLAPTQLFARGLDYRLRGVGSVENARAMVAELRGLDGLESLEPEDVALHAFLLAEAEDVITPGTGEATLRACLGAIGPHALVALGLAERAMVDRRSDDALRFFAGALEGDLLGLRVQGRVALSAAEAAEHACDGDALLGFLDRAVRDPETRRVAMSRLNQFGLIVHDVSRARHLLRELAGGLEGSDKAEVLSQLARILFESMLPSERIEADRTFREAIDLAPDEIAGRLRDQLDGFRSRPPSLSRDVQAPRSHPPEGELLEDRRLPTPPPGWPAPRQAEGQANPSAALRAMAVIGQVRSLPPLASRLKELRRAIDSQPFDRSRLVALRDAVQADNNPNSVRAIDHVLRAFDRAEAADSAPVAIPPLGIQNAQPGMFSWLTSHSNAPAGEALREVWDGARVLLAKPPSAYRMTGLERVSPGPSGTLSRLSEVARRLLATPRFDLFHRRADHPLALRVALLQHPSAIVEGRADDDSATLRWTLGHALAMSVPQIALTLGVPSGEARRTWETLLAAFGPKGCVKLDRADPQLAEFLWQTLPPRAQKRIADLLLVDSPAFDTVVERAVLSSHRLGLFLGGDFDAAARAVLAEHPELDQTCLDRPGGLASLCHSLPVLTDLYRFAVTPEYADARWYAPSAVSLRAPSVSGVPTSAT